MRLSAPTLQELASEYQSFGLPAIPIHQGRPLVRWEPYRDRLPAPEEVEQWPWERADGLGIVLGHRDSLTGLHWWVWDIERQHRTAAEDWLNQEHPGWWKGLVAVSQRGGLHVYCLSRQPVPTTRHPWGDVKAVGSLVFAPPSQRYKPDATQNYEWLSFNPEEALQLEPADLPWPDGNGHRREPLGETLKRTIPIGSRNTVLTRVAGWLRGEGQLEPDEVLAVLRLMNVRCVEPLPDEELQAIARSSGKWSPNPVLVVSNGKHEFVSPHIEEDRGEISSVPDSWLPVPISELGTDTVGVEWLWDGFLAKGHVSDFVGFWKSGKTTLLGALLQRMEHGGELAGREVRPGKALVVTEEPRGKWLERREALNLADHVHVISRPFPKRPNHAEWHAFTSHITRLVTEHGYDLVVFDSLPNLWCVRDENDASEVISALLPLQGVASAGCAVLLVRHPRKSDGGQATAGRGSGAIAGFVDIIIEMRRYDPEQLQDTRRVLSVYSRYEPYEVVIRWNGDGEYETLGTPGAYSAEAQRELLLEALAELGTATTGELAKAVELPHSTASKRLSELEAAGRVVRRGAGKRGDPHRWSLTDGGDDDPDGDDFVSPRNTHKRGETKTDGETELSHAEAKIGGHGSADFVSPRNSLIRGETKTDGKPENPHQSYEIGGQTPVREAGETELSHEDAKIGGHGCVVCGKPVAHWGGKPARFCSDGCRKKFTRQQGATGRVATVVEKAESGPPDPGICLDCHQPITAEGFQYRCPACLKARYDRLRREYPEKLVRWLQTHDQKEGRR
jgi:DNA-binding transcriptional ArsR family regulator